MQQTSSCLSHSYSCNSATMLFAHFGMIYCIACIVYLLITRCVGTPFNDSLTKEQQQIKQESAQVRGRAFLVAVVVGIISIHVLKPFKEV
jgi:hypothetical protein